MPATTSTRTDSATGVVIETLKVPVVQSNRAEDPSTPNGTLADFQLGVAGPSGTSTTLSISLPAGTGMVVEGAKTLLSSADALTDLIKRIESKTDNGTAVQDDMVRKGQAFLGGVGTDLLLQTKTVTLNAGTTQPAQPIEIKGAPVQDGAAVALVIDARGLPAGSVLHLNDVEFAAVVGQVAVTGGDGRNFVIGDDASQRIYLGADDDELHGGGGDDIMGSAGGDDLIDGGAGNDIVIGGIGNDTLQGGTGDDVLVGGRSDVGQWRFSVDAAGKVSASHDMAVLSPGNWEAVAKEELDSGTAGLAFLNAAPGKLEQVALLYHTAFGRAPDLGGLEYWAGAKVSATDMMTLFMRDTEYRLGQYASLDNEAFVQAAYQTTFGRAADQAGLDFWLGKLGAATPLSRADLLAAFALSDEHHGLLASSGKIVIGEGTVERQQQWFTASGDDVLYGGTGNDILIGGDGVDTIVYDGTRSQYRVVLGSDNKIRVVDTANGDIDTISGIEKGNFADGVVDLGFTQAKASTLQTIGMLYQTLFDRAADAAGLNWWLGHGDSPLGLARAMMASPEYSTYAALGDAAFVAALYQHTGLQATQAGGTAAWEAFLQTHSRAELLAAWIGNAEVIGTQFAGDGLWLV